MSDEERSRRRESRWRSPARRRSRSRERSRHSSHRERELSRRRRASRCPRRRSPTPAQSSPEDDKSKPNMELSGKLAAETNVTTGGVVLKFNEPPEARLPQMRWRIYIFKSDELLGEPIPVHRQTCYLFGRDRSICDLPTDHPSCSKQHCVLQYRCVREKVADGTFLEVVKPYLMDLESINGTFINKQKIEPTRYYEIMERDTIRLGLSSRDYVFLHEDSTV
eukprot:g2637.t1